MKKIIRNILQILNENEKQGFGLLVFLNLAISIIDIGSIALLLFVVNFYTKQIPFSNKWLPEGLANQNSILLIAAFLLFFSVKSIAGYYILKFQYSFVYKTASRISEKKLLEYLEGSYSDYVNVDSSVLIRKISHQPIEFAHYVLAGIQQIITESILVLLTVIAILIFSAKLFLLLLVILVPAVLIIAMFIKKRLRSVRANVKEKGEKALQYLNESLAGYIECNMYESNHFFVDRYAFHQESLNRYLAELQITQSISSRIIEVFAIFGLFMLIAVNKFLGNAVDLTTIAAFVAAAYKIIPGIVKILNTASHVKAYEFAIDGLAREIKPAKENSSDHVDKIQSISFQNISFEYGQKNLFSSLNMEMKAGDFAGLSGISGKGKTTMVNLLLGFLQQSNGAIYINDIKKNSDDRKRYWKDISYVKQQPFLIHDSILNNIVLGEQQYDKKKLNEAVRSSGLHHQIEKYPEGLQKLIAENGKNISGGQRQRIAIARALYKNSSLIILDEPFNELDEDSEYIILEHLRCIAKSGKIILLITHNKKSFSFCNKIISFDE